MTFSIFLDHLLSIFELMVGSSFFLQFFFGLAAFFLLYLFCRVVTYLVRFN